MNLSVVLLSYIMGGRLGVLGVVFRCVWCVGSRKVNKVAIFGLFVFSMIYSIYIYVVALLRAGIGGQGRVRLLL